MSTQAELEEARQNRDEAFAAAIQDIETPPQVTLEAPVQPVAVAPVVTDDEPDPFVQTNEGWEARLDLGEGGTQVFKGKSRKEVEKALLKAQINATKKIREQNRQIKLGTGLLVPDAPEDLPTFEPRELTADEQFEIASSLTEPAKARSAFRKALEAEFGAPVEVVRRELKEGAEVRRANRGYLIAQEWADEHPEFWNGAKENREAMQNYVDKHFNGAITKKNLTIAFNDLSDSGLLKDKPVRATSTVASTATPSASATATGQSPAAATPVDGRPRASATGISQRDTTPRGAEPAKPISTNLVAAAEQYKRMKSSEVRDRMRDPQFRKLVDKLSEEGLI